MASDNRIHAPMGIDMANAPFQDVGWRIVANDITWDLLAVLLGSQINHSRVETAGNVLDEGTDNRVVAT